MQASLKSVLVDDDHDDDNDDNKSDNSAPQGRYNCRTRSHIPELGELPSQAGVRPTEQRIHSAQDDNPSIYYLIPAYWFSITVSSPARHYTPFCLNGTVLYTLHAAVTRRPVSKPPFRNNSL